MGLIMPPTVFCRERSLTDALTDEIGRATDSVSQIYAKQNGDHVTVWTIVDDFSRRNRDLVYEAEERIMATHPNTLFDFHVLASTEYSSTLEAQVAYTRP